MSISFLGLLRQGDWKYVRWAARGDSLDNLADDPLELNNLVVDPPGKVRACDEALWLDPQGRLWLFWMQAHTLYDGRSGVWCIVTDQPDKENPIWSAPRRLMDGVMLNKPIVNASGEWLFPVAMPGSWVLANERRMLPKCFQTGVVALMSPDKIADLDQRAGAKVYVSDDSGETWKGGLILEERACSYPDGFQAPDGTISIIYDHARRAAKMILMARFNEEDILAGRFASPRAKQHILVDQGTGVFGSGFVRVLQGEFLSSSNFHDVDSLGNIYQAATVTLIACLLGPCNG